MGLWDYEANQQSGYPEGYLEWYHGEYKPLVGDDAVGEDKGVYLWQDQKKAWEQQDALPAVPEGTLVGSNDAGANAEMVARARKIPNITDKLNGLMADSEAKYRHMRDKGFERYLEFKNLVRTGGEYDLKNKTEWQPEKGNQFIYDGEVVNSDVPGNIHYGHFGKVFNIPDDTLAKAAGANQLWNDLLDRDKRLKGIISNFNWDSFGDDPRDTTRIRQGIDIYNRRRR